MFLNRKFITLCAKENKIQYERNKMPYANVLNLALQRNTYIRSEKQNKKKKS